MVAWHLAHPWFSFQCNCIRSTKSNSQILRIAFCCNLMSGERRAYDKAVKKDLLKKNTAARRKAKLHAMAKVAGVKLAAKSAKKAEAKKTTTTKKAAAKTTAPKAKAAKK